MKLLTLNTHSLLEENYSEKLDAFVDYVLRELPDIIALQEVNQSMLAPPMPLELMDDRFPVPGFRSIRVDNHAAQVARRLNKAGVKCYWAWLPIKIGYEKYDEGVAILSLGRPIRSLEQMRISQSADYENWRTRAVLGVQVEGLNDWFYTVHMGWWEDSAEPFLPQWKRLNDRLEQRRVGNRVWLLGDFNAPHDRIGESYDTITASGWIDTYQAACRKDSGITVPGAIDGWRTEKNCRGMRLDYIWTSHPVSVDSSRVVFNGLGEPVVSDHYGVMIETKEEF